MEILLIIFGVLAVAGGIFGKDFYRADVITLAALKDKSSTWSGRLLFIVVGTGLIAIGIKLLWDAG
jgi:hypothetical protein